MISKDEVWALAQGIEEDRVEKTTSIKLSNSQVRDKYGEAICAFANDLPAHNKPGYLLIGVSNDGTLSGLKVEDRLLQSLMDFRTDGRIVPPPSMSVAKFGYDTGDVAVVEVMPHQLPPVRYEHRVHIGIGPRRAQANEQDERILNEKRSSHVTHFDAQPCMESSLEDISQEIFQNTYLPNAVSPEILQENHREPLNQLASLKFFDLKNNKPTNAGILMFGKNPMFFLPGAYIQYVRFEGNTVVEGFQRELRFSGDLTTQMRVIEDFIKTQVVHTRAQRVENSLREEYISNYPWVALREFLFNSIIHRDYSSASFIKFYEFDDYIEITNPGGLFGNAQQNFPENNDYRNPTIAEATRTLGYVNRFNVGIKNAKEALAKNGNVEPEFFVDSLTNFTVKIFANKQ